MEPGQEAPKMRDLYGLVGYAIFLAQALEGSLEQAIQIFIIFPKKREEISEIASRKSIEEWHSFIEENDLSEKNKMLGRLLSSLRESGSISEDVLDSIDEARKCRNYIAHQYFKENLSSFYTKEGQDAAVQSLSKICRKIQTAINLLGPIVQNEMNRYGYDAEYLVEFAKNEIGRG